MLGQYGISVSLLVLSLDESLNFILITALNKKKHESFLINIFGQGVSVLQC